MQATVTVNKRAAARVRALHCWVYRSDLTDSSSAQPGALVRVVDHTRQFLGQALYSSQSEIALRFVTFKESEIGRQFWMDRLTAAEQLRGRIVGDSTAYRLVYSDSDLLPSLIIDRYRDCFVIQTLSQGMEALKQTWCDLLIERYAPRSIVERNDSRVRDLEGLPRRAGFLYGEDSGEVVIEEAALTSGGPATLKFTVDLVHGQKTGAFLDQRENRLAAETYARGKALDCFTGEGGFALHLARHAEQVTAIDISAASLERAALNAALNQRSNVEFVEANVFDWLRQTCNSDRRFDLIVLDPPAFAKNRASIQGAYRGYKEINLRALKLLNRGGILITCSCSHHISELDFLNILASAAADARRAVRIIEKRGQARDHPVLISMPETYYLKCVILEVV